MFELHMIPATTDRADSAPAIAINCTDTDGVSRLLRAGIAENSARALHSDLRHFRAWGGSMPSTAGEVASYIAAFVDELRPTTLARRIASLSKAHEMAGYESPCRSELVKATLRGARRLKGTVPRQATPLLRDDLFLVLDRLGSTIKDVRDKALLLTGFAGGFRRSELVGINVTDVERVRQGLVITIRKSKTDQEGTGRKVAIPIGHTRHCPVLAFEAWLAAAAIENGPVFRAVNRHAHVDDHGLSPEAVSLVVRNRAAQAGLRGGDFMGHSLRAGLATSAAQAGVPTYKIRAQTGHASDAMLMRYVRDADRFVGNAAGVLL